MKKKPQPVKYVCSYCGSDDVKRDAWAVWSTPEQKWELSAVFDYAFCEACGGETNLTERQEIKLLKRKVKS